MTAMPYSTTRPTGRSRGGSLSLYRRSLLPLLLFFLGVAPLVSQPNIAYIIPDIGAANMNTAVEILAPQSANGSFGSDGFYANNPGDPVRVEATGARAADLVVGPVVVSWGGRLISTQIFVRPGAAPGTIPLRVTTGAGFANTSFDVVVPYTILTIDGTEVIGAGAAPRSKRGTIIADRLIMNGSNNVVATDDQDLGTPGEQGYLPLIIIARELVALRTPTISVDGNGTNGAPGGGGGGGQVCDRTFLGNGGPGTAGGDGYTGGGGGGQNWSGGASSHRPDGDGTGAAGAGLTAVASGTNSVCFEGSGGGTGHPFGRSGQGWCGNGNPIGYYGGASTGGQNAGGGGAGNARDGANGSGSNTGENRGRINGNTQIVPLAGGSGGASGNPQSISGGCGGAGGGGGGAIAIYSMIDFNSQAMISANGASGGGSGSSGGGGGSGGAIVLGTKAIAPGNRAIGTHRMEGGNGPGNGGAGSVGRFRFDGFLNQPPSTPTSGATTFVGVSIDTLTYSEGLDFMLRGTRGSGATVQVYMRTAGTAWTQLPNPVYNNREWTLAVTTSDTGYHYIVAFQQGGPADGPYTDEPVQITSQVAANIVRVESVPKIEVIEESGSIGSVGGCPRETSPSRVFAFASVGTEDLNVRIVIRNESSPGTFRIIGPAGIEAPGGINYPNVDPDDTIEVFVSGFPPNVAGPHTADMLVITNDPRDDFDTVFVELRVTKSSALLTVQPDTLDFGQLCRNGDSILWAYIDFEGSVRSFRVNDIRPERAPLVAPVFYRIDPDNDEPVFDNPLEDPAFRARDSIGIRFLSRNVGLFLDSFEIIDECDSVYTVYVKGEVVEVDLRLVPGTSLNFRRVLVGSSKRDTICIQNTGGSDVTLGASDITGADPTFFRVVEPASLAGVVIPAGDSIKVVVEFSPTDTVNYTALLEIPTQGPCEDVPDIFLSGIGVEVCFDADRSEITYIADSCAVTPAVLDSLVTLTNCGGTEIDVLEVFAAEGKVTPTLATTAPIRLRTGNEAARRTTVSISWDPADGTGIDSVAVVWQDVASGDIDTIWVRVDLQFDRATVELQTTSGAAVPDLLDIGGVFQCGPAIDTLVLVNSGTIEGEIFGSFTTGGIFTLDPSFATPYVLPVGGSQPIQIRLDPANAPTPGAVYEDTLVLVNGRCNQEWRVALRATRYELTVDVANVDFGATNLGLPRQQTVTLTNTTVAPPDEGLVISRVYIDPPGASPPFAVESTPTLPGSVLADGGTFAVDASFTPDSEQLYTGQLCFEISSPCDTTICVDLRGEGIRSNIYVPQGDLTFGKTYYCAEDTLGLTIYSVGPVDLEVDSIRIVGPDAAGFEILSLSQTPPVTLAPGFPAVVDSIDVAVRFIPANVPPDGMKMATLEIYSNDTAQGLIQIPLSGERTSPEIVGPASVDFSTVIVGQVGRQRITLTNTSDDPITIASPQLGPNFRVASPLPLVVPAQGSIEVDLEFLPSDSEMYRDTLVGSFTLPCDGELRVELIGEGLRGETLLSIPAGLTGEPGERIAVPVILEEATALGDVGATTVRVWLRFDKHMLMPVDADGAGPKRSLVAASSGGIFSDEVDGDDRVVGVEFVNDPLPTTVPNPLGFVDMVVLLGDALVTPITFDSIRWVDGEVTSSGSDGEFALEGYCDVGGARLVRIDGEFGIKSVAPNPIAAEGAITFETVENGPTQLAIYDMTGARVVLLVDRNDLPTQAHRIVWQTDAVAAGAYNIVLETPTQRDVVRIIVR